MKKLIALLLLLSVFFVSPLLAKTSIVQENFLPTFTDSTFTVQNETTADVGWLTITVTGNTYSNININASGTFSTTLSNYAVSCSIHGQSFSEGTPATIIIDTHTTVRVSWSGSILVVDQEITH